MQTRLFKYIENFTTKNWKFSNKNYDIYAQNIYCVYSLEPPRRGGSNEYPQFMFLSRNKKNTVYPCKPQFYGVKIYTGMFSWCMFVQDMGRSSRLELIIAPGQEAIWDNRDAFSIIYKRMAYQVYSLKSPRWG